MPYFSGGRKGEREERKGGGGEGKGREREGMRSPTTSILL